MSRKVRVLIADDHLPTRSGVRQALEAAQFEISAEVGDAAAALEAARRDRPDICLLDIHMPGNGIAAAKAIRDEVPETVVVMLTVSLTDADLFDSLRAGAVGYLLKDTSASKLPVALRAVLAGEAALPRTLVARLVAEFRSREDRRQLLLLSNRSVRLTGREWEILDLLRENLTTREIAERLFISPGTVRSHVSAILGKFHVSDRKGALRLLGGSVASARRPGPAGQA